MGIPFSNYLTLKKPTVLRDYRHASRLYVENNYGYAPKVGFLYYVVFNINPAAIPNGEWKEKRSRDIGLLVKKIDLPKFTIANETLNQYNRKTVVSTKITYNPVNVEFHDDNLDIINKLWMNYYDYHFADEAQAEKGSFGNTKYGEADNVYGIYNSGAGVPFFDSVDIYTLHQQDYTQMTLVNPKISEWQHDSLNQAEGNKIQTNKMTLAYESVIYKYGIIRDNPAARGFTDTFYDKEPSPLVIGGNDQNSTVYVKAETGFDTPGSARVFNSASKNNTGFDKRAKDQQLKQLLSGSSSNAGIIDARFNSGANNQNQKPSTDIVSVLAKNNANVTGIARPKSGAYNIGGSPLSDDAKTAAGKYASKSSAEESPGLFASPGGVGINVFKELNVNAEGKIIAVPAEVAFTKRK